MRKHVALAATLPLLAGRVFGYNLAVNWTITPDTPVQVAANLTDNGDGYRKFKVHLAMAQTCTELDSSRCQVSGPVCEYYTRLLATANLRTSQALCSTAYPPT